MSKSYFGLVDSRNSKYQGLISDDQFAGIGMLIDQTTTFALSTWLASNMNGPSIIIYPTTEIFFGTLEANQPKGIACFQFNRSEKCIINFDNIASSNRNQTITIAYVVAAQSVVQLSANRQTNEFKLVQVHYINQQEDQLKLLSKIFTSPISKYQIDFTSFINKNYLQTSNLFELSGKNQLFFGFKDTISVGFKIQNNAPTSVGFYKPFPRNLIFGRKIHYNIALPAKTSVEEGYFDPYVKTFTALKEKASSLEFQKVSEDYFKKSTTFRNQFVTLDFLSQLHKELTQIGQNVKHESAKRYGQILLENNYGSSQQNPKDLVVKEYTLEEMKQQIYKAAAKKNKVHYNASKSPIRQRVKKPFESLYLNEIDSPSQDILTVRKTKEPQLTRNQSFVMSRAKQNTPLVDQRRERGFTYINSKKQDAIKGANQIIKQNKEQEIALLKNLVKDFKNEEKSLMKKREFNYSKNVEVPVQRSKKYQRYQPKITPFSQVNERNSRSALKSSNGRQIRYTYLQKAKQDNALYPERELHEIIRRDKQVQKISAFELNPGQTNTKSHSNLQKYKERNKQATIDNLMKKDHKNHYKYFDDNQNQKQRSGMQRSGSQIIPEIKLFDERTRRDKQNQQNGESQTYSRPGQYLNQDLSKSTQLGNQNISERYLIRDKSSYIEKSANQQRQRVFGQPNGQLKKNYQRSMLYENKNDSQSMRNNEERKKVKRTYNYID